MADRPQRTISISLGRHSLFRVYLPPDWRPPRVELNVERPRRPGLFEDVFQCPVHFNAPAVTVVAERHRLSAAPRRAAAPIVTLEDLARDRRGGPPRGLVAVVLEQVRAQVLAGGVSIDNVAHAMDSSLVGAARVQRATELLRDTNGSVTRVSAELGYSSPANFARAFRKATGRGPREFRSGGRP